MLAALLQELGLAWLDPDDSVEKRQLAYQREWQTGDFDDRIPAFQSRDNRVMLGLQNSYNIINFANGVTQQQPSLTETCLYSGHHRLALFGIAESVRNELEQIPDFICQVFPDLPSLLNATKQGEVDAIVISSAHHATEELTHVREGIPKDNPLPITFIGRLGQQTLEAVVFELGASDFIHQHSGFGSFRARLNRRINTHKALALLTRQARIDELTGLSNRRSFEQQLEREWRQGCRYQLDLAVVILDCDDFKAYNDNYGHFAGDECLRRLADRLAALVHRPADVVARLGGGGRVRASAAQHRGAGRIDTRGSGSAGHRRPPAPSRHPQQRCRYHQLRGRSTVPHADQTPWPL